MDSVREQRRNKLKAWGESMEGKVQKNLKIKMKMTNSKVTDLQDLIQQFQSLGMACIIAKRDKDASEIEATMKALDNWKAMKNGGKKRESLMMKRNKYK